MRSLAQRSQGGPHRGFTLVELVAIMVVLAVMAGVALPTLGNLTSTRAGMAARQLLRDFTHARQRALATGTTCWITIDMTAQSWTLLRDDPANPGLDDAIVLTDAGTGKDFVTFIGTAEYLGVDITACDFDGSVSTGFDWMGKPLDANGADLASEGTVTLTGGHQITVNAGTGMITHVTP